MSITISQQSLHLLPPSNYKFVFYIGHYSAVLQASLFVPIFYIPHRSDIMILD